MKDKTFSVTFESDIGAVKKAVMSALRFLVGAYPGMPKNELMDLRLILSEALLNAVTHGNSAIERKKVSLSITAVSHNSIEICIADEGAGFDYEALLSGRVTNERLMSERGRGLRLVHSLSDKVVYNEKGNEVKIYKKVVTNG